MREHKASFESTEEESPSESEQKEEQAESGIDFAKVRQEDKASDENDQPNGKPSN